MIQLLFIKEQMVQKSQEGEDKEPESEEEKRLNEEVQIIEKNIEENNKEKDKISLNLEVRKSKFNPRKISD